jgi:hypothetical protein
MPLARLSGPIGTWGAPALRGCSNSALSRTLGGNGGLPPEAAGSSGREVGGVVYEAVEQGVAADEALWRRVARRVWRH